MNSLHCFEWFFQFLEPPFYIRIAYAGSKERLGLRPDSVERFGPTAERHDSNDLRNRQPT